ncbi:hypothetical protein [Aeromonas phage AerS_266]|nr:hypothetical protein [Aeromonas phage AerS_266]
MSIINGLQHLTQIVNNKISPLCLKDICEVGDYYYETIIPDLLLEFRIIPADGVKIDVPALTVSYYSPSKEDVIILTLPHFKTYTHKQLVKEIHKALAAEMFKILGENKKMVFDDIDYYQELKYNNAFATLANKAKDSWHRKESSIPGKFKSLINEPVQL